MASKRSATDDDGPREEAAHQQPIAGRQVDADDPHPVAAAQALQETRELGRAFAGTYVEDPPVL